MNPISRREFGMLAAAGAVGAPAALRYRLAAPPPPITAQEIVDRIRQKIGAEWKPETVDTFKAGEPARVVKGIVTTAMATMARSLAVSMARALKRQPMAAGGQGSPRDTRLSLPLKGGLSAGLALEGKIPGMRKSSW